MALPVFFHTHRSGTPRYPAENHHRPLRRPRPPPPQHLSSFCRVAADAVARQPPAYGERPPSLSAGSGRCDRRRRGKSRGTSNPDSVSKRVVWNVATAEGGSGGGVVWSIILYPRVRVERFVYKVYGGGPRPSPYIDVTPSWFELLAKSALLATRAKTGRVLSIN